MLERNSCGSFLEVGRNRWNVGTVSLGVSPKTGTQYVGTHMKSNGKDELVSGRGLAEILGVSEGAVRKAKKAGRITQRPDGKFDPKCARKEWERNTAPRPAAMIGMVQRKRAHADACAMLMETVRRRISELVPRLALRLGLPLHIAACAHELLDEILYRCGAPMRDDTRFDPDFAELAEQGGYTGPEDEVQAEADVFFEKSSKVLDELEKEIYGGRR